MSGLRLCIYGSLKATVCRAITRTRLEIEKRSVDVKVGLTSSSDQLFNGDVCSHDKYSTYFWLVKLTTKQVDQSALGGICCPTLVSLERTECLSQIGMNVAQASFL